MLSWGGRCFGRGGGGGAGAGNACPAVALNMRQVPPRWRRHSPRCAAVAAGAHKVGGGGVVAARLRGGAKAPWRRHGCSVSGKRWDGT